jgi:endosialidase-like protein
LPWTGRDVSPLGILVHSSARPFPKHHFYDLNYTSDESNNILIGANVFGVIGESNTIRIGTTDQTATFIAGIFGKTSSGGTPVYINSNGKLGTTTSSKRFKENIKPMDNASEAILALKPVTFRYKKDIDPASTSQFGLVAEDVEKVNPDLIVRDKEGKPYTVRYDAVNAMLLNEFLKEHEAFLEQQHKVQEQGATIALLEQQIEALTAGLQKVSDHLQLNKSAPRTVLNDQ